MPCYSLLGLRVELPWSLELARYAGTPDVEVQLCEPAASEQDPDGSPIHLRRKHGALELTFNGLCRAVFPTDGGGVLQVIPEHDADLHAVRRQVLEHVVPRLLSRIHALVLHASSVVLTQGAVGFLAPSGSGKSTLALALARRGRAMLSDDSLVVDLAEGGAVAHPLWSNVRIHVTDLSEELLASPRVRQAITDKAALQEGDEPNLRFAREAQQLRAIYLLDEADDIQISKVAPREAMLALLREAYHLEFDDMPGLSRLMLRTEELGLTHRTYRLSYPRDFERLDQVCDLVIEHEQDLP